MMALGFLSVLSAGLLMGILHAFDPDHVMTMSSLGARPDARGATARYALSWGVGHGGILVIAALALLVFSSGVLIGMMGFGHGLDRVQALVATQARTLDKPLRGSVAVLAIGMGSYWLVGA
jgi:hypothetical protein